MTIWFCRQTSAFAPVKAGAVPRGEFSRENRAFYLSQKPQNPPFCPFQRWRALIHTPRTRWLWSGLPSQEATGNGSIGALALAGFASRPPENPEEGVAGGSSPVTPQASDLKCASSNFAPPTKKAPLVGAWPVSFLRL